jgi:hypothetical protein
MMSDPVDDLLETLDQEVAVEPSAELVRRVRTAATPAPRAGRARQAAAGAVLAMAALTALVLWRGAPTRPPASAAAARTAAIPPPVAQPWVSEQAPMKWADDAASPVGPYATSPSRRGTDRRSDEVVVSPETGQAMVALQRAIATGQITLAAMPAREADFDPAIIAPAVIVPAVIEPAMAAVGGSPDTPGGGGGFKRPLAAPSSRMGSVS